MPGDLAEPDLEKGLLTPEREEPTELAGRESEVDGLCWSCCLAVALLDCMEAGKSTNAGVDVVLGLDSDPPNDRPVPNLLRRLSPAGSKAIPAEERPAKVKDAARICLVSKRDLFRSVTRLRNLR